MSTIKTGSYGIVARSANSQLIERILAEMKYMKGMEIGEDRKIRIYEKEDLPVFVTHKIPDWYDRLFKGRQEYVADANLAVSAHPYLYSLLRGIDLKGEAEKGLLMELYPEMQRIFQKLIEKKIPSHFFREVELLKGPLNQAPFEYISTKVKTENSIIKFK